MPSTIGPSNVAPAFYRSSAPHARN